jgi:predicted Zn finger-like uncharacterized protein
MSTVRLRRLQADYLQLRDYLRQQPRIRLIQVAGDPPERYQLEYQIKSLRQIDEQLQLANSHTVEITLPLSYPRMPPQCRMLTPIFHPNIAPHAICIGDHWSPGEPLWSMVSRIGEMIAYQSYNTKSPLNGEAARWVEQNLSRLPIDSVILFVDTAKQAATPQPKMPRQMAISAPPPPPTAKIVGDVKQPLPAVLVAPPSPQPQRAIPVPHPKSQAALTVVCPNCKSRYRVPSEALGKKVRCRECQRLITVTAGDVNS